MKILMLAPEPFLEPRGTPISVYQRLRGLSQLGYEVDLVTYHLGAAVTIPRVTLHRVPRIPLIRAVRSGPSWQKLVLDLLLFWKAFRLLTKNSYDVIHAHEEAALFGNLLARVFGTRHVYDMHSSLPQQLKSFSLWGSPLLARTAQLLESWTIRRTDAVITIAADLAQRVRDVDDTARCAVIENLPVQSSVGQADRDSVDALRERLGINGRLPIMYTGNLQRYQGIELLVESAEIVKAQCPEVVFLLVGGKRQEIEEWEAAIEGRGLEGFVRFLGTVPLEKLPTYLELAEILVSPRTDGMSVPLKIYSYLHSGKPIIATSVAAHTLVLGPGTALLVAPTREALAAGITRLATSPALRQQLGSQARGMAQQKYDSESYLLKLDQVYRTFQTSPAPLVTPSDAVSR